MPTKVLIIDGGEASRSRLGQILKKLKCWCVLAADEAQARNRLNEHAFELVLVDIDLPGRLGLDLLQYLRSEFPRMAAIVVTSVDDPLVVDAALEAGVYGYLVKPVRPTELFIHVSCALRRRSSEIKLLSRVERLKRALQERTEAFLEARKRLVSVEKQLQGLLSGPDPRISTHLQK